MEEMLLRTRVVSVKQQYFLSENLRGGLCKSGMHLAIHGWDAARADGGMVGQHTGRLAGETGSFPEIALRCRSWWGKATTLFMQSEGYREVVALGELTQTSVPFCLIHFLLQI